LGTPALRAGGRAIRLTPPGGSHQPAGTSRAAPRHPQAAASARSRPPTPAQCSAPPQAQRPRHRAWS